MIAVLMKLEIASVCCVWQQLPLRAAGLWWPKARISLIMLHEPPNFEGQD